MADQAKDGRLDVEIRSATSTVATDLDGETVLVTHQAACRWCPESLHTPDVRTAVKWADAHEMSLAHTHTVSEARAEGRGPREPWPVL